MIDSSGADAATLDVIAADDAPLDLRHCRVRHGRPNALKAPYPWIVHTGFVEGTFCDHHMQFDRAHWMLAGPSTDSNRLAQATELNFFRPLGPRMQYTGPQSSLDMNT